jgi:hypothetical protein
MTMKAKLATAAMAHVLAFGPEEEKEIGNGVE